MILLSDKASLPLFEEPSCALGNLTLHYLDELCTREDPTAEDTRREMKERGQKSWFTKSKFSESLEDALPYLGCGELACPLMCSPS